MMARWYRRVQLWRVLQKECRRSSKYVIWTFSSNFNFLLTVFVYAKHIFSTNMFTSESIRTSVCFSQLKGFRKFYTGLCDYRKLLCDRANQYVLFQKSMIIRVCEAHRRLFKPTGIRHVRLCLQLRHVLDQLWTAIDLISRRLHLPACNQTTSPFKSNNGFKKRNCQTKTTKSCEHFKTITNCLVDIEEKMCPKLRDSKNAAREYLLAKSSSAQMIASLPKFLEIRLF